MSHTATNKSEKVYGQNVAQKKKKTKQKEQKQKTYKNMDEINSTCMISENNKKAQNYGQVGQ